MLNIIIVFGLLFVVCGCGKNSPSDPPPPNPELAAGAPPDQPVEVRGNAGMGDYRAAIAPYIESARKTYPEAKKRYLNGLPAGHSFFVVTNLQGGTGTQEQVFVAVSNIRDGRVYGRLASDILGVKGYKKGATYTFPESDLVDWLISRPDGTEEGNVVGKFLDEWQKTKPHN